MTNPSTEDLLPSIDKVIDRMKELPPQEVIDDYREQLMFYIEAFKKVEKPQNMHQEAVMGGMPKFAR